MGGFFGSVGHLPVSAEGTATTVICDVPVTFLYQVDSFANAAKPGNLFAFISPAVFMSGEIGASSR